MKRTIILAALLVSGVASAATAHFTGRSRNTTTVTGRHAIACEYEYYGQTFWETFEAWLCPMSIQVR